MKKEEIELEKLQRAAEIARKIDDDLEYRLEEEELDYLLELSKLSKKDFDTRLNTQKFLARKRREKKEEEDAKLMYAILVWICKVNPIIAAGLCTVQHTPTCN